MSAAAFRSLPALPREEQAFIAARIDQTAQEIADYVTHSHAGTEAQLCDILGSVLRIRIADPIVAGLEVGAHAARLNRDVFAYEVGEQELPDGRMALGPYLPDLPPAQARAIRRDWLLRELAGPGKALPAAQLERVRVIRDLPPEELTSALVLELQRILLESNPGHELFSTEAGREMLKAIARDYARAEVPALLALPSLSPEKRARLTRFAATADDDLEVREVNAVLALAAERLK